MVEIQIVQLLFLGLVLKFAWAEEETTPGMEGVDGAKASGPYLKGY